MHFFHTYEMSAVLFLQSAVETFEIYLTIYTAVGNFTHCFQIVPGGREKKEVFDNILVNVEYSLHAVIRDRRAPTLKNTEFGFTLMELLAVVTIIGITSAVAIPGIVQVVYRNKLIDTVSLAQEAASRARAMAIQTNDAVVVEFRPTKVWINRLAGGDCNADIARRCASPTTDSEGKGYLDLSETMLDLAGLGMCGAVSLVKTERSDTCAVLQLPRSGFGLCYTGRGHLFVRNGADEKTECDSTDAPDGTWQFTCSQQASADAQPPDGENAAISDGSIVLFNRYDADSICTGKGVDVRRGLFFPTGGNPYARIAPCL